MFKIKNNHPQVSEIFDIYGSQYSGGYGKRKKKKIANGVFTLPLLSERENFMNKYQTHYLEENIAEIIEDEIDKKLLKVETTLEKELQKMEEQLDREMENLKTLEKAFFKSGSKYYHTRYSKLDGDGFEIFDREVSNKEKQTENLIKELDDTFSLKTQDISALEI